MSAWLAILGLVGITAAPLLAQRLPIASPGRDGPLIALALFVGLLLIWWTARTDLAVGGLVGLSLGWFFANPLKPDAFMWLLPMLAGAAVYGLFRQVSPSLLTATLVSMGLLTVPLAVAQFLGWDPMLKWQYGAVDAMYGNPMVYASALAPIVPLAPTPLAWGILMLGLGLSGSSLIGAALLGTVVAHGASIRVRLIGELGGLATAAASGVSLAAWATLEDRLTVWAAMGRAMREWSWSQWLLGGGPGAFFAGRYRGWDTTAIYGSAHNEPFQLGYEYGVLGGLCLLGFLLGGRWRWDRPTGALVALALVALGAFPFRVASTAVVALAVMAVWQTSRREIGT